ncbi:hypothetical protein Bca4012_020951 [Brassica carinata]
MAEYDGRLVVFNYISPTDGWWAVNEVDKVTKNVQCMLVSLHRAGEKICGTIDWSGIVATVPIRQNPDVSFRENGGGGSASERFRWEEGEFPACHLMLLRMLNMYYSAAVNDHGQAED